MALDTGSIQQMRQVYGSVAMTRVTANLRALQMVNREHEADLRNAKRKVIQDPHMSRRIERAQQSTTNWRTFAGQFSEIESTPVTIEFNHQYENQWQDPLDSNRMAAMDTIQWLGEEEGKLISQVLDHDVLGYMVRGEASDGTPGLLSGAESFVPTRNQFRFGSDTNYLPLEGNSAGETQGTDADANIALKAIKRISLQMQLNSHLKTGTMNFGRPKAFMMPAVWRNIAQSAEAMNIETWRPEVFEGRDVTPEGYCGTVYDIECHLVNPAYPDGANSGQAFFKVNQDGRLNGSLIGAQNPGTDTGHHDNQMMIRRNPTDRATTTASTLRNHAVILAGFEKATTFARAEEITKLFSPQELQSPQAYKGWQFSLSFRYMRRVLEPNFLYLGEIQCVNDISNTGGG